MEVYKNLFKEKTESELILLYKQFLDFEDSGVFEEETELRDIKNEYSQWFGAGAVSMVQFDLLHAIADIWYLEHKLAREKYNEEEDGLISREIASIKWNKVNMRKKDKNLPPEEKYVCWAMLIDSEEYIHFRKFFGKLKDGYVDGGTFRYKLSSNFWWSELSNPEVTK